MTTERKILISAGVVCITAFIACFIMLAYYGSTEQPLRGLPWAAAGLAAFWIGSSIADALRKNPEK